MQLSTKHLLGIKDLQASDIQTILDTATQFKEVLQRPIKKVPTLRDVTIVNLFYENSPAHAFPLSWQKNDFPQIPLISPLPVHPFQKENPCWIRSTISFP